MLNIVGKTFKCVRRWNSWPQTNRYRYSTQRRNPFCRSPRCHKSTMRCHYRRLVGSAGSLRRTMNATNTCLLSVQTFWKTWKNCSLIVVPLIFIAKMWCWIHAFWVCRHFEKYRKTAPWWVVVLLSSLGWTRDVHVQYKQAINWCGYFTLDIVSCWNYLYLTSYLGSETFVVWIFVNNELTLDRRLQ